MTVEQLRRIEDNKHIDDSMMVENKPVFDDWRKRESNEYKSSYLRMLSEIYDELDCNGETESEKFALEEMKEWIEVYMSSKTVNDSLLANIHACKDFLNGEDLFGENYA